MRKLKLTPLQNRIIWILEEAGEETLDTIRVTLRTDTSIDEQTLVSALQELERLSLVSQAGSNVILTSTGYAALSK